MAIDKEMQKKIDEYNKEIKTLEDIVKSMRQAPGMYIGPIGNQGFLTIIKEIYQNAIDEFMKNKTNSSPCTMVKVYYDARTKETIVEDNGRGLPFDDILRIITEPHTSSHYNEPKPSEYSAGVHGIGAKATNAFSSIFIVESRIYNKGIKKMTFKEGYLVDEQLFENPEKLQGTKITFRPSECLGNLTVTTGDIYNLIESIVPLTSIGDKVYLDVTETNGETTNFVLENTDGLSTYLYDMTTEPLIEPITTKMDNGTMKIEFSFTYAMDSHPEPSIVTFANYCYVRNGGIHLKSFLSSLCSYYKNYMNNVYMSNNNAKKKITITNEDIRTGLKCALSTCHVRPIFTGQAKDELSNEDIEPYMKEVVYKTLDKWASENPQSLQKLCKYFKEVATLRLKAEDSRKKVSKSYKPSAINGLPYKYDIPKAKKNLELLIVEGDSAKGSVKNIRNEYQGLFPIKGKIPNAFRKSEKEMLANEEINGIMTIISDGKYGSKFNIEKCKFDKIIFLADSDKDGSHINSLLLRFFAVYYPQLIEAGRVFSAQPPLYSVKKNGKEIYFKDRHSFVTYTQELFSKKYNVCDLNGNPIEEEKLTEILYNNIDYTYEMDRLANTFAVSPVLIDYTLINLGNDVETLYNSLKNRFTYIQPLQCVADTIIIEGFVDNKTQSLIMNDMFIRTAKVVKSILDSNENKMFVINDTVMSLYEFMKLFDKSSPSEAHRFKGLGEMNPHELKITTVNPEVRNLVQYTFADVKKELEAIDLYEKDLKPLITDAKVTRLDLME